MLGDPGCGPESISTGQEGLKSQPIPEAVIPQALSQNTAEVSRGREPPIGCDMGARLPPGEVRVTYKIRTTEHTRDWADARVLEPSAGGHSRDENQPSRRTL